MDGPGKKGQEPESKEGKEQVEFNYFDNTPDGYEWKWCACNIDTRDIIECGDLKELLEKYNEREDILITRGLLEV
jgi:hypothetical protein